MLKIFLCLIALVVIIISVISGIHLYQVSSRNKKEMAKYEGKKIEFNKSLGKVLVVYYSLDGNTKDIAMKIKEKTGGDIYEIKSQEPISKNLILYFNLRKQIKQKQYPKLHEDFPDISGYDVIFIGSPVWWYTVSTPVLSFLEKIDLQSKKIVPFSTQGSNVGTFYDDFKSMAKNADIMNYISFNNLPKEYDDAVDNKINDWLNNLK